MRCVTLAVDLGGERVDDQGIEAGAAHARNGLGCRDPRATLGNIHDHPRRDLCPSTPTTHERSTEALGMCTA